jgi:hypothetical protein
MRHIPVIDVGTAFGRRCANTGRHQAVGLESVKARNGTDHDGSLAGGLDLARNRHPIRIVPHSRRCHQQHQFEVGQVVTRHGWPPTCF